MLHGCGTAYVTVLLDSLVFSSILHNSFDASDFCQLRNKTCNYTGFESVNTKVNNIVELCTVFVSVHCACTRLKQQISQMFGLYLFFSQSKRKRLHP